MKHYLRTPIALVTLLLSASLALSSYTLAAPVQLATSPLATSSASVVQPNLMLMLDDSGSMDWDYMPDNTKNFSGKYGYNSSQCNGVYYNPTITYSPPVDSTGASYANSSFTAAPVDGYVTGAATTDLSTSFTGGSGSGSSGINLTPQPAFYYTYSGTQTTSAQMDYFTSSSTFYQECNSAINSAPGNAVFTLHLVSATSGPGNTDERTNFANWYSYYSTRMKMMKTGLGLAFRSMNSKFRIGFMTMNNNVSPDIVDIAPFTATQKSSWYSKLYGATPGQSTPLRQTLSQIGYLYANKFAPTITYTATITVSGNTTSSVSSILVGTTELMGGTSNSSNKSSSVATNVAGQINAPNSPIYSATAKSNVVTITGGIASLGLTPVVTSSGGMAFTATAFTATTVSAQLNGIVPRDPIEYSCQKNFVILSTDGYWNGNAGYKLDGTAIGNQDALAPRPMYDGSTISKTTSQVRQLQTQVTQTTSQTQMRTVQEQKQTSQLQQDVGTLQTQTSILQTRTTSGATGTKSKVLMRCNNTSGTCGTAPSNGIANTNWSVVASGSCTVASNVQCQIVSGLSGNVTVATTCNTAANITQTTGNPSVTVTITNSNKAVIDSVSPDGNLEILSNTTSSSSTNSTVASLIATKINACTSNATGNCDTTGQTATVGTGSTSNVITITGPNITNKFSINVKSGSAKIIFTYSPGVTTYTLNNADSNGMIYSACTTNWSAWANATAACTPSTTTQCQYTAWTTAQNATGACTPVAQDNTNLTARQCSYTWLTGQGTPACSTPSYVANNYTNTTVYNNCTTVITSPFANAACGTSSVTTIPNASGNTTQCRTLYNGQLTDSPPGGYVGAPSCTPSGPTNGLTVICPSPNPVVTNSFVVTTCPTTTSSCSAPYTSSSCMTTSCTTKTIQASTLVASCNPGNSGTPNFIQTSCNTTTSTPTTVASCVPQAASSSNGYTATNCTGAAGGTSDTLADTSMYYYQTDLRDPTLNNCTGVLGTGIDVCPNNVRVSGLDNNDKQHLTTFTLGLGARGRMAFSSTYLSDTSGDFYSVKTGSTASAGSPVVCSWQTGGACNWPTPASNAPENIDDLWHAAVNGRGSYFSATDPATLSVGLSQTLKSLDQVVAAAAAAATSTLNPVANNNFAYVASYTTVKWTGNLEQRTIDINTGVVSQNAGWCVENLAASTCAAPNNIIADTSGASTVYYCSAPTVDTNGDGLINALDCTAPAIFDSATVTCRNQIANTCSGTLPTKVAANSDTRTIYTANSTNNGLVNFDSAYAAANPGNFSAAHISGLSQWPFLTVAQQTAAAGTNLINYLRGQKGYEENRTSNLAANWIYRYRDAVMGDALESQPTFIGAPTFSYADPGYSGFVTAQAARASTVFIGANDGMLHAFAGANGMERWAYVPSVVIPNMWQLADKNYNTKHVNFVNGSPLISDICMANCTNAATAVWRTILVGGLNAGGRGYYALDITDPVTPTLLWEFTPAQNANLGYSYGRPVVTKKADGTWVVLVTSGYDNGTLAPDNLTTNSPAGDGLGYLYVLDATNGSIISTISTGVGSATTPSGLAKFNAYSDVAGTNQAGFVYAGDLLGNVWRFDINAPTTAPFLLATLKDSLGNAQPITAAPTLGKIMSKRVIFVGTGKYLEPSDLSNTQVQSLYAIKDDNATATLINPRTTLIQQTITSSTSTRTGSGNAVDFSTGRGWYVDFPDTGERTNIDFKLVQGTLLVPTIVPSSTVCSPGGYGWLNYFNYENGNPIDSTGYVSQRYDSTIVGMNVIYINGQPIVEIVTSSNPTPEKPATAVPFRASSGGFLKTREVWRELIP